MSEISTETPAVPATAAVRKDDLDVLVAAVTNWAPGELPGHVHNAFARLLNAFDQAHATEDAPGSGPQPAKVIVVTEVPIGDGQPVQRRYQATQWDDSDYSRLRLIRSGQPVGTYAGGAWLSVREEGATANDGPADKRKLAIALDALRAIGDRFISDDLDEDLCRVLDKIAGDALGDIADVDL